MNPRHALAAALFAVLSLPAAAADRGEFTLDVLVRGAPLREYDARGTTYVEARKGSEYALRLTNRTGRRIAVALSVDGLNTIDAKSGPAREARKWILDPWQTVVIEGWQTDANTARRFFFTSEEKSYGTWLGRTDDLGVIAAVVYREKRPDPPRAFDRRCEPSAGPLDKRARTDSNAADELAATGIGRETDHRVVLVDFDAEPTPSATVRIRYEYRDALVRLGVLPRPVDDDALARRERAQGFDEMEFAPDPYAPRHR